MIIDYTVVDAFVDPQKLDSGNPAAVIILDSEVRTIGLNFFSKLIKNGTLF